MVAGFNMLSFDLFGLTRKAHDDTRGDLHDDKPAEKGRIDDNAVEQDEKAETDLFYLSLYPVF